MLMIQQDKNIQTQICAHKYLGESEGLLEPVDPLGFRG